MTAHGNLTGASSLDCYFNPFELNQTSVGMGRSDVIGRRHQMETALVVLLMVRLQNTSESSETFRVSFSGSMVFVTELAVLILVVLSVALFATEPALAEGPDHFRVDGVSAGHELNLRASPSTTGTVVGTMPYDADGISNFGCIGGLTFDEYENATDAERAAARMTRWCKVGYERTVGWAAGWYLAEGSGEDAFRAGASLSDLAGTEWQVRDFAGEEAAEETWIAFGDDGTVTGLGGCNHFNGGYSLNSATLTFGPLAATQMACPDPQMNVETMLFQALDKCNELVAAQLILALFDGSGTLLVTLTRRDAD